MKVLGTLVKRLGAKAQPSASTGFESETFRFGVDMLSHCATLLRVNCYLFPFKDLVAVAFSLTLEGSNSKISV